MESNKQCTNKGFGPRRLVRRSDTAHDDSDDEGTRADNRHVCIKARRVHSRTRDRRGDFWKSQEKESHIFESIARLIVMTLLPVAVHTLTGHKVAMKFISKHVINMTRTKNRVQREVEYMRTLRHPHIIKLSVPLAIASFHI